ncbi:MAG: formate/nitrite transporter family protein [Rhodospirillales bacterium]|nr:formate/nitrite transporter family protein [Rhodospirillales bacterium]
MSENNEAPNEFSHLVDAYAPPKIAALIEGAGVRKVHISLFRTVTLGVMAGVFIAFGAVFFTVTITNSGLGLGPNRLLGGIVFSLGLILVVIGGAELFTGNNLIAMAWADKKVTTGQILKNWVVVYIANLIGAVAMAVIIHLAGTMEMAGGAPAQTANAIAIGKVNLSFGEAFFRGILCNTLVCLAVWMSYAAHRVSGKILAIIFPVAAFVALGFEHSVANMYFLAIAMLQGAEGVTLAGAMANLIPVTIGNIIGGSVFVALVYWAVYLRRADA